MFGPQSDSVRIMVRPGVTDMRKAINGLSVLVEQELSMSPLEDGVVFLFCNRILSYAEATGEAPLSLQWIG